jgi:hypothetical protein
MADLPRSGDTVLQTAERLAPLMALIAPFIDGGIGWLQQQLQYTVLGDNYAAVLQGAIAAYLPILLARRRMRQIRVEESLAAVTARTVAWELEKRSPDGLA